MSKKILHYAGSVDMTELRRTIAIMQNESKTGKYAGTDVWYRADRSDLFKGAKVMIQVGEEIIEGKLLDAIYNVQGTIYRVANADLSKIYRVGKNDISLA